VASGHEDFGGYVQLWGDYDGTPTQVGFDVDGNPVIVWID